MVHVNTFTLQHHIDAAITKPPAFLGDALDGLALLIVINPFGLIVNA